MTDNSYMEDIEDLKKRAGEHIYLIIMFICSVAILLFAPFLGSAIGLEWTLPNTVAGWIVWVITRLLVAILNVIIFYCFIKQGEKNSKNDPNKLKADEILNRVQKDKDKRPLSPKEWKAKNYGKKMVFVFFGTLITAIGVSQALLNYDFNALFTYAFTVIMGIVFGILQMKSTEYYWTVTYLEYANYIATNIHSMEIKTNSEESNL